LLDACVSGHRITINSTVRAKVPAPGAFDERTISSKNGSRFRAYASNNAARKHIFRGRIVSLSIETKCSAHVARTVHRPGGLA
jgi:hypothetical protein